MVITVCSFEGCDRTGRLTKGLCAGHYRQLWKGEPLRPLRARAQEGQRYGEPCSFVSCARPIIAKGLCKPHYYQSRRGSVLKPVRALAHAGAGHVNSDGYRVIFRPGHPNASGKGRITEHRWIMAEFLGRPLERDENVHHVNGNRLDNRLENLELWSSSQPPGQRVQDKVAWAREILARYGDLY